MKYNVGERLTLLDVLPATHMGDIVTGRIILDLRDRIGFTASEVKKLNLKQKDGIASWSKIPDIDISLDKDELDFISARFDDLEKKKRLPASHIPIMDRVKAGDKPKLRLVKKTTKKTAKKARRK